MKRKKLFKRVVAAVSGVIMAASLFLSPIQGMSMTAEAAISNSDFLKTNGKVLKNNYGNGDAVYLRGTNAGGYLVQEFWMTPTDYSYSNYNVTDEMDIYTTLTSRFGESAMRTLIDVYQDNYWTEKDFDNCKNLGINCIRLPFWYMNFVDFNGNYIDGCFDRIDWFLQEAGERGIYVILDMHGAPGSQNGSDHSGIDGGDNKEGASEFFFGNNAWNNQQLYYDIWYKIAQRYAGNPTVAGYDLLNEPYCTYRYNSSRSESELHNTLWSIYDIAYDVIRSADPDHVIIMEATWDAWDLPNPSDYGWENVMYEYHNYLYDDYDNAAGQQIVNMQNKINSINSMNYNVPSYMGEFCYMNNTSAWQQGLQLLNNNGLNWTTWTYKVTGSNNNWGLYNQNVSKANVATDSYDTIYSKWSQVGQSSPNTNLLNAIRGYFPGTINSSGSSSSTGSQGQGAATLANGEYYFVGTNTNKVVCGENYGNDPLVANRDSYGGDWEKLTLVNNSDGTISLKSGSNGLYVCAVIDESSQLLARSAAINDWEKFNLVKVSDTEYGLKAVANGKYVCVDEDNGNVLYANRDSISGWESFRIYTTGGTQMTPGSNSGSTDSGSTDSGSGNAGSSSSTGSQGQSATALANGEYYFVGTNTNKVVCGENYGNDPLVANRDSYGGDWEKLTLVNNSDGTISLKSGSNGLYVCAVIDESSQLLARSAAINDWEKFNLVKVSDTEYGLKAVANGKYVCVDEDNGNVLYANRDSISGWESFRIYTTGGTQMTPGSNSGSADSGSGNEGSTEGNENVNNGWQDNGSVVNAPGEITEIEIVDVDAVDATKSLFVYLKEVGQDNLLFGHQNDNSEGIVNKDGIISDTYHTVGAYPAITGFEMANIVNNSDYYVGLVKQAYKNNSIATLCDHMPNFSSGQTGYTSGDMTPTYNNIMPGGADHWEFLQRLDQTAEFALSCVDENGELIPIIYRPFHENSGNWFWWGTSLTKEQFVNLWRFTVEYLRDEKGVHNLLYAYSPNGHFSSEADYLSRYPGDDYVDIIGLDIYHDYPSYSDQWMQSTLKDAQIAASIANQKGKVAALTEVGLRYNGSDGLADYNNSMKDWFTRLYDTLMNDESAKQIAYMMTWRNQDKTHFWVPYDNGYGDRHEMADNFTEFYNKSNVIFADRLGNFAELKNIKTIAHENAGSSSTGENIAYHKAVEVSSIESSEYSGSRAVDADGTTRWSSAYADEQYIIVDLGEAKKLSGVRLAWEAAYASQYQIQVSNDYDNWTTVYSNYNSDGGTQYIDLDTTARYVKVYCIRRATSYGFSLYEFEIY